MRDNVANQVTISISSNLALPDNANKSQHRSRLHTLAVEISLGRHNARADHRAFTQTGDRRRRRASAHDRRRLVRPRWSVYACLFVCFCLVYVCLVVCVNKESLCDFGQYSQCDGSIARRAVSRAWPPRYRSHRCVVVVFIVGQFICRFRISSIDCVIAPDSCRKFAMCVVLLAPLSSSCAAHPGARIERAFAHVAACR
jgi:hypothetical protein